MKLMVMNKKRWAVVIVCLIAIIAGLLNTLKFADYYASFKKYRHAIESIKIMDIDLSKIPDGVYQGKSEAIWVAADVKVVVKGQRITDIELVNHINGRGKDAEVIIDKVVEAQSLKVDTISGATSSSKVILKAIENALRSKGV